MEWHVLGTLWLSGLFAWCSRSLSATLLLRLLLFVSRRLFISFVGQALTPSNFYTAFRPQLKYPLWLLRDLATLFALCRPLPMDMSHTPVSCLYSRVLAFTSASMNHMGLGRGFGAGS